MGLQWIFSEGSRTADGIAHHFTSPVTVLVQEFLLLEGGFIVLLFGVMALGDHLIASGGGRWARVARIFSVTAIAMFLPAVALPIQVFPGLADLYVSGHPEVGVAILALAPGGRGFGPYFSVVIVVLLVVAIGAAVSVGVAGWRSRAIPRWCCIAYPIGFVLNITDTPVIAWVGLGLLLWTGIVMARSKRAADELAASSARFEPAAS